MSKDSIAMNSKNTFYKHMQLFSMDTTNLIKTPSKNLLFLQDTSKNSFPKNSL